MNTCLRCGFSAQCGCVFEMVNGEIVCKKCMAYQRGEKLKLDLKLEMESQEVKPVPVVSSS